MIYKLEIEVEIQRSISDPKWWHRKWVSRSQWVQNTLASHLVTHLVKWDLRL